MKISNFNEKIELYKKVNPNLSSNEVGILLLLDDLYNEVPKDVYNFRNIYAHLDPKIIDKPTDGITFLKLVDSDESQEKIKEKLNNYINVKFNYIGTYKSYDENMKKFRSYSNIVSGIVEDILHKANFPSEIIDLLKELDEVKNCYDFYELLALYKKTENRRIKFAILRKIGLIILLSRINRTFAMADIDFATEKIEKAFKFNLGIDENIKGNIFYCIDENHKIAYCQSEVDASSFHKEIAKRRKELALEVHPIESFEHKSSLTKFGNKILHFEIRNKLRGKGGEINYTSFVEKIVRKNLEFPNMVRDVIGIRIVVENTQKIPHIVSELEAFLGGSSTRKKEKNALNKFGKKEMGKYSSKDFSVWKAIYDIALPHPSIDKVMRILNLTKKDEIVMEELKKRIEYFKEYPRDFVVEVQLQDLNSYLLGNAKGSTADHSFLKMNQIRSNSFYKLFPKEIYKDEVLKLKSSILKGD